MFAYCSAVCAHACVLLRQTERVWRQDSGLHVCDQTKQGLKEPAVGWGREKMGGEGGLYCPGGGLKRGRAALGLQTAGILPRPLGFEPTTP